ncbi:MAG: hypothetical protein GY754_37790 [bacterium]|nr:hypothetical protein [bacterium]
MKFIRLILLFILVVSLPGGTAEAPAVKTWAYILHSSRLSSRNLDSTLPKLDAACITGFKLTSKGKIKHSKGRLYSRVRKKTKKYGVPLYPLIGFSSVAVGRKILRSPGLRKKAISSILRLVKKHNFTGVHLDFEYLPPAYAPRLAQFLKELRPALKGSTLSMALFPPVEFPARLCGFHDPGLLAPHLDQVVLMCYDYHSHRSGPGPVTGVEWSRKNISEMLRHFKPGQVWLGIPAYGYHWREKGRTRALSARAGMKLVRKYGSSRHPSGCVFVSYKDSKGRHTVYFSDKTTRRRLTNLARKQNLAGTALWRMGFED